MKLRIRGNSIRLRLTQNEVENIKTNGIVEEKTEFPNGNNFVYVLLKSDIEDISTKFSDGKIEVLISESTVQNWANSDETGIYGTHGNIQIAVEKDFKCLTPRKGDDDADTFPHPKENC